MNPSDHRGLKRVALLIAILSSFLTPFMGSSVDIALPSIGKTFAMNAVQLGWMSLSYLLAATMFLVPFGRTADIHGRKRVFTCGILVDAGASLLAAIAWTPAMLPACRFLQGVGRAMIFVLHIGKAQINPACYPVFLGSKQTAFSVSALLCWIGVFASLARGNVR